jgi:2-oxoglutarate ferredoxin oxidoreductase subunit gamma
MNNDKVPRIELVIAGFGGQGVLTIGLLLAKAGLNKFKNVTWFPTYETFMRGGTVACYVISADEEIYSPLISEPEIMIICDQRSLDMYEDTIASGGTLIYDSSLIEGKIKREDIKVIPLPASELAQKNGSPRVANLVLLGAYLAITEALSIDVIEQTLEETLKEEGKETMIGLNKKALRAGFEYIKPAPQR